MDNATIQDTITTKILFSYQKINGISRAPKTFLPQQMTHKAASEFVCVYVCAQIKWCRDWDECVHNIQPSSTFTCIWSELVSNIWVYLEPMAADCLSYEIVVFVGVIIRYIHAARAVL